MGLKLSDEIRRRTCEGLPRMDLQLAKGSRCRIVLPSIGLLILSAVNGIAGFGLPVAVAQNELKLSEEADPVEAAIGRGIRYLIAKQREDGAITDRQYDTTMTSLAIMALAST